jgi:hypothetical protein
LSEINQGLAEADAIFANEPITDNDRAKVEYLRGRLVENRANVGRKLRAE